MFENSYNLNYQELNFELANRIYELIRQSDEDICKIVSNIEFRTNNIKNIKDHVFLMNLFSIDTQERSNISDSMRT